MDGRRKSRHQRSSNRRNRKGVITGMPSMPMVRCARVGRVARLQLRPHFILLAGALAGCSPKEPPPLPTPRLDAERVALLLEARTPVGSPVRILFDWAANEGGVRWSGKGVARVEPRRVRLDLFLDNGELAVKAAVVNRELRLPSGAPDDILPPPDFMWGALGVFHPIMGSWLLGGEKLADGSIRLRYRLDDREEIRYRADGASLVEVELVERGHVTQRVEVEHDGEAFPASARYRNMAEFREIRIERVSVQEVEPFPPDIWEPAAMPPKSGRGNK